MRVSVTQQGGLFDVNQTVTVVDDVARLVDRGKVSSERRLDRRTRNELERLAMRCVPLMVDVPPTGAVTDVYDSMTTTIAIDEGDASYKLTVRSADDVPAELDRLVDVVMRAPYEPPPGSPRGGGVR